jgi:hypothetical protein
MPQICCVINSWAATESVCAEWIKKKMQRVFERLQALDATPNQALIDAYNQHFGRKNPKYQLIVSEKVRPCFFSGDIESPGNVVTISLNPAYSPQVTEAEQAEAGVIFADWYNHCRFRFRLYPSDAAVHQVFRNLFKIIAPPETWPTEGKRSYLQAHLLNLDWCYYYSEQFPSIDLAKLPPSLRHGIEEWDTNLYELIKSAIPRYIFVHGQAMQAWVNRTTSHLEPVMELVNSRRQPCRLFMGKFAGTSTSAYYLEHFINVVNENTTLKRINRFVNENA